MRNITADGARLFNKTGVFIESSYNEILPVEILCHPLPNPSSPLHGAHYHPAPRSAAPLRTAVGVQNQPLTKWRLDFFSYFRYNTALNYLLNDLIVRP